ncbi:hypothetical protein PTMSG1_03127 [Pyrenophora teres f. maculata]|nr:hypothetical protein PTMSG1_03127 [Pyrenophora teres f. maculata]
MYATTTTNVLTALTTLILLASPPTTARVIPPLPPHIFPRTTPNTPAQSPPLSLNDKCTFTLFHKQLHTPSQTQINYIQLNTLTDHTNALTIDIAAQRPPAERNSYVKVGQHDVFALRGLFDDASLRIWGKAGSDELKLGSGRWEWSTARAEEDEEGDGIVAWCNAEEWNEGGNGSRERSVECGFPCARIEEDEEREELR